MSQTTYSATLTAAYAGMLADNGPNSVITRISAESSAEIPFGSGVKQGASDEKAVLPAAETDDPIGIVLHSHAYAKDTELGSTGLKPKTVLNILRKGRVWLVSEDAVTVGARLWCRAVAGVGEQLGAWRVTDDSTDTIDCTKVGVALTSCGAGGLFIAEVDFTNELD